MRSFGDIDARLLIVGLAPGMKGANRTGRPFTGDYAGDLLYSTLLKYGFAQGTYKADPNDGLRLVDCRIANAVRCLPPENKPLPVEFTQCRPFLQAEIAVMPELKVIVALGKGAHDQVLRALTVRPAGSYPFIHARLHSLPTGLTARRQLPLLALQHEHRPADDRDVPRRCSKRLRAKLSSRA